MTRLRPILLVEDSARDAELTLEALAENKLANEVAVARDGAEALDYLYRKGKFAGRPNEVPMLVLLDLKLPKVDGLEVLRRLKSDPALKTVPVVMVTSSREEKDLVESYALGVNAYVVKPVGFEQFTEAVKNLSVFWAIINEPPPDPGVGESIAVMDAIKERAVRILHLEDNDRDAELVSGWLEDDGIHCEIERARTAAEFLTALGSGGIDLIISDYKLPGFDGLSALKQARERLPDVPFILFSGTIGEELAVQSLKTGATDYVLKQRPERLITAVRQAQSGAEERGRRREAENRLREQAALLDKAQDAILVRDMEDRVTFWNRGAERIYGWSAAEALGQPASQLVSKGDSPELREALRLVREQGEWFGELNQVRRDGKAVVVESRWTLLRDEKGQPVAKLIINTDVTARKELEAQLRQAQKMEAVGHLAGGVAHDFNNMLAVIRGNAELLLMSGQALNAEASECVTHITEASERAANLTRQLLLFSRKQAMQAEPLVLSELVANVTKMLKRVIREDIRLECRLAEKLPFVQADPGMMEQVLLNLVVNARDAMPRGGRLEIVTETARFDGAGGHGHCEGRTGEFICLSVRDTGTGIAPEHLGRIFEPFFTTKEPDKGTGLGLATVYGIAKQHQGWVDVSSRVGQGTTFSVFLPAIPSPESKAGLPLAEGELRGGKETILLAEDDYAVRMMTRRVLETFGYTVHEATCAREAVEAWEKRAGQIALLLTDMVMPDGVTGRDLAERLRAERAGLKVIFMSGYSAEVAGKDTEFFRRSKSHFLHKPCATRTLIQTVRQCLDDKGDGG